MLDLSRSLTNGKKRFRLSSKLEFSILLDLLSNSKTSTDAERKSLLIEYFKQSRIQFVKLLVLVKWARSNREAIRQCVVRMFILSNSRSKSPKKYKSIGYFAVFANPRLLLYGCRWSIIFLENDEARESKVSPFEIKHFKKISWLKND